MKQLAFTMMMVLLTTMHAQAQKWEKVVEPGDALKGTSERVKYQINDSTSWQQIAFYQPGNYWKVGVGNRVFQPDKRGAVHFNTYNSISYATIGFYNEQKQLVKKWKNCIVELTNGFRVAEVSHNIWGKTTKGCRDVVPYLMSEKGYVRIIIPTVIGPDFDMTVPCLNNEQ